MFYYSKKSKDNIFHTEKCFHVKQIGESNLGVLKDFKAVRESGGRLCRCCSPLVKRYQEEGVALVDYCRSRAVSVFLTDGFVGVCTPYSRWRIVPAEKDGGLQLYHRNTFPTKHDDKSIVPKYHLQNIRKKTLKEYLEYIVEHEYYRMMHPVEVRASPKEPARKGTRRYKNQQKKQKRNAKKQAVNRVLQLIESLHIPQQAAVQSN